MYWIVLLLTPFLLSFTPRAIFVFGPSCSGKTTLAEALQNKLGKEWVYVHRDVLIRTGKCSPENAEALMESMAAKHPHVIVDARFPWRSKHWDEVYVLLMPPLATLLARSLQRNEKHSRVGQNYVKWTYSTLKRYHGKFFDYCLDSAHLSLEQEISIVLQGIDTAH